MTRRTLDKATTAREVCAALDYHPDLVDVRQTGSHRIYRGPHGTVIVPAHGGDLARGTLRSILRMAALAGLAVLLIAVVAAVVMVA
jgi:predicted RNA binding protein YcfA (HicA-like mRNA interferase family)